MEKGKTLASQLEELLEWILVPLLWITFVWESKDMGLFISSKILAVMLCGPPFGLASELIYIEITGIAKFPQYLENEEIIKNMRYSKYSPYSFFIGFVIGLPFILQMHIFTLIAVSWLNFITYPSLLAQYMGFTLSIFITWSFKEIALILFTMSKVHKPLIPF